MTLDTLGFDAIRFIYALDTQDKCFIKATVAATASAHDPINPVTEDANRATWVPVTFNNLGYPKDWDSQVIGQINCNVAPILLQELRPAPVIDDVPNLIGYTFSDWVPLSSYKRTDGGQWPLLMHRTYACGKPRPGRAPRGIDASTWGGCFGERILGGWSQRGDFVEQGNGFNPGTANGTYLPLAVQFHSRSGGCTIMNVGDSIAGGVGAGGLSFAHRLAMNMSQPNFPVSCFTVPWGLKPGVDPTAYFPASKGLMEAVKPAIIIPQLWSRNWSISRDNVDCCFQEALKIGYQAMKYGGTSIFLAPLPCPTSYQGEPEVLRSEIISRVKQLRAGGYLTYDPNPSSQLGTGEIPNSYQAWASDDQCHPNAVGHNHIALQLQEIIEPLLFSNI